MNLRKRLLKNCRLYLVLDKDTAGKEGLLNCARAAIRGGVDILQLRWKNNDAKAMLNCGIALRKLTKRSRVLFIIDDEPVLANVLDADGVHLGHEDCSVELARAIIGPDRLIGCSTHSVAQARNAVLKKCDYISIGPVFKTPIKAHYKPTGLKMLERLKQEKIKLPVFGIGGINLDNIKKVTGAGIKRIAVVRAIVRAKDPARVSRLLKENLK